MSSFIYTKLERSIQDTSFEYITNLDDYKALSHILNVIIIEKAKKPILQGVFSKILHVLNNTISGLEKITKSDGKSIDVGKLESFIKAGSKKIILVRNEEYNSFASFPKGFEDSKLESNDSNAVLYNVGQLETSGSISVVPTNANVFMSSMLYTYTLLFSSQFFVRQNVDILIHIAKIYYTIMLSSFGKKSGLLVGSRKEKEFLFFLIASFVYSIYVPMEKQSIDKLKSFLSVSASSTGSSFLKEYFHAIINVSLKTKDSLDPVNYRTLFDLSYVAKQLNLMTVSESEIKIQWFRLLSIYGVMALENYSRFTAYIVSTFIPNSYFTSTLKVYNKASYEYLVEYYLKELFSFK